MGSSTLLHLHSQSNTSGCIRPTSHVLCIWPVHTQEGWSVRCAGAQAQQPGIGDFWTSDSPDEAFALSPTATVLIWKSKSTTSHQGNKGMSALAMLAIDNLKNFWKIFLKLYMSSFMFKQTWNEPSTSQWWWEGEDLLLHSQKSYFQDWRHHTTVLKLKCRSTLLEVTTSDSKSLASGKPQGNLEHDRSFP